MRSLGDLVALSNNSGCSFVESVYQIEEQETGHSVETIRKDMESRFDDMALSVQEALSGNWSGKIIKPEAKKIGAYVASQNSEAFTSPYVLRASQIAIAVATYNAAMGRIVAAPTAGSCGILPGLLFSYRDHFASEKSELVDALTVAGAVGAVVASRATLAGAEGGCQAECGAAAAMGAAALVALREGAPDTIAHSVSLTFKSVLGLVCDPIGGLVESPCIKRNGLLVSVAALAADMALAGIKSILPADEVIDAMGQVGRAMPETLRETARGGLAVTPTAQRLASEVLHGRW
ncbi:L-serine ammonia-lyase, iron-sulfur-dependent, subunit alpha [Aminobacterium mobile]|jgi:L-serine dehydratase